MANKRSCFKQHKTHLLSKYKQYLNKLSKLLRQAKRNYYHNLICKHKNNLTLQWKLNNEIIGQKKNTSNNINIYSKNSQVNQQASADRPVSSLLGLTRQDTTACC